MGAICACACGGGVGGGEVVRRSDRGDDVRSGGEQSLLRINHAPGALRNKARGLRTQQPSHAQ